MSAQPHPFPRDVVDSNIELFARELDRQNKKIERLTERVDQQRDELVSLRRTCGVAASMLEQRVEAERVIVKLLRDAAGMG